MKIKKGRNTVSISLRLDVDVARYMLDKGMRAGFPTIEGYLKEQINKSYSAYTTLPTSGTPPKQAESAISRSVFTTTPKANTPLKEVEAAKNHSVCTTEDIPVYDPLKHMPGDTVRMWDAKQKKHMVVVL